MRARLLLAAIVLPAFSLSSQRPRDAAPTGAATAAVTTNMSGVRVRQRLRWAVFLGVLEDEAGAAVDVGLLAASYTPYRTLVDGTKPVYAESGGKVYAPHRSIEDADDPPASRPTINRWSVCWWVQVVIGWPFC